MVTVALRHTRDFFKLSLQMGAKVWSFRDVINYFVVSSFSSSSLATTLTIRYETIAAVVFSTVFTSFM